MNKKTLQIEQLESKMKHFSKLTTLVSPPTGWVRATRLALGISLQQMAKQLKISKQSAQELEQREKEGAITIKSLSDAAEALNMKLVYGFVPLDGSLDNLIERKAKELATQIVLRTSNSMKLENQKNSEERIKKAIKDRTVELKKEIPKSLWD
jgi:predicted DNA-binding mobile mystery protein A